MKRYFHHVKEGPNGWIVVLDTEKQTTTTIFVWSDHVSTSGAGQYQQWANGVATKHNAYQHWVPCTKCQARKYMKRNNFKYKGGMP